VKWIENTIVSTYSGVRKHTKDEMFAWTPKAKDRWLWWHNMVNYDLM